MEKSIKLLAIALVISALLFSAAQMLSTRYVFSYEYVYVLDTWTGNAQRIIGKSVESKSPF